MAFGTGRHNLQPTPYSYDALDRLVAIATTPVTDLGLSIDEQRSWDDDSDRERRLAAVGRATYDARMLQVHGFSRVNEMAHGNTRDLRVLWALEEIGMPYTIVGMDHPSGDLDSPEFRAKNPFGQLPVIDDDGVVVSESGAILLYLARKSGKLMPRDLAGEAQVLRWSVAALSTIELPVLALWFVDISGGKGTRPREALRQWSAMRVQQLDAWLANRTFVATDDFTVADILMTHVLGGGTDPSLLAPHANILAYRERCTERPAWKKAYDAYCRRVQVG